MHSWKRITEKYKRLAYYKLYETYPTRTLYSDSLSFARFTLASISSDPAQNTRFDHLNLNQRLTISQKKPRLIIFFISFFHCQERLY